jgi:hypothetical protein
MPPYLLPFILLWKLKIQFIRKVKIYKNGVWSHHIGACKIAKGMHCIK